MGKAAVVVCPVEGCNQTFKQEPRLYDHLKNIHSVHDVELYYIDLYHNRKRPVCACDDESCRYPLEWHGWKKGFPSLFRRGHNIKKDDAPIRNEEVYVKASASRIGQIPWNTGLTKETDERVAASAVNIAKGLQKSYDEGKVVPWQLGETKETNNSLRKQSDTKKEKFASGDLTSWNEGLTKETNESLSEVSRKMTERLLEDNPRRFSKEKFDEVVSSQSVFDLISSFDEYKNRDDKLRFKCRTCGGEQLKDLKQLRNCCVCFKCHPKGSAWQVEVYDFIKSYFPDAISSDRTIISPLELDVYVPSKKFAVECNGLFYHCELNDNFSKDHIHMKTVRALKEGVRLMHVFEDEWMRNRELVKKMILHRLGISDCNIDARKGDVILLEDISKRRAFFKENHLDGDVKAKASWALVHEGEIVAVLSVKIPRERKTYPNTLEVARFATKRGMNVRGALGKLMKSAEEYARISGYKKMMTYVDRRVGEGSSYLSVGFNRLGQSEMRFWWTDRKFCRLPRQVIQGKNQAEQAAEKGLYRIFGCKNYVLEKVL